MKSFGKKLINKKKDGEKVPSFEVVEVVLVQCTLLGLNFAGIKFCGWPYPRNLNISRGFNFVDSLLSNFSLISRLGTPNLRGILWINFYSFLII